MSTSKRRRVIAGNWKMYKDQADTRAFFAVLKPLVAGVTDCDMVIAPPFTDIPAAIEAAKGTAIAISAQDVFWEQDGAYTGQISTGMLVQAGCGYTIVGHSERRQFFGETNETVLRKTQAALGAGLTPIVCIGEMLADREAGNTEKMIEAQFKSSVGALTADQFSRILIAYEPVWAIGTGRTATPEIAAAVHKFVRQCASAQFSASHASAVRILYGGSVKPDNIQGLMAQEELDGALVGGASLDPKSFASLVKDWPR
jgi:triosephosphate isomerase (TIM)